MESECERSINETIAIPIYPELTIAQQAEVVAGIALVYA
jgi:dTDP-4-amino-4,6-dideoxygalactose transaminase